MSGVDASVDVSVDVTADSERNAIPDRGGREEKLVELRRRLAALPDRHRPTRSASQTGAQGFEDAGREVLPVRPELARQLPGGGLPRGTVATVSGVTSLAVSLVATLSGAGSRVALCGAVGLSMAAAVEQGADLERVALIEGPLADPVAVASILLDGADVVLCGLGGAAVPASRSRALAARARAKGSILLVTGGQWEGAALHLNARVAGYTGLGSAPGRGRVRGVDLIFSARGRGCVNPHRGRSYPREAVGL